MLPKPDINLSLDPTVVHDSQRQSKRYVVHIITALYEGHILRMTSFRKSDPLVRMMHKMIPEISKFYNGKDLPIIVVQKRGYVEVRRGLTELQARAMLAATTAENSNGQGTQEKHPVSVHQRNDEGTGTKHGSNGGNSGT